MKKDKVIALLGLLGAENIIDGGEWMRCSCPFAPYLHSSGTDRSPSFGIEVGQRSRYWCFSCKSAGNLPLLVTNLIMFRGEDNPKARQFVIMNEDLSIGEYEEDYEPDEPISIMPEGVKDKFEPVTNKLISMITRRKISKESIEKWELMWDQAEKRVIFPIRSEEGFLVGFRGRAVYDNARIKYRAYTELSMRRCDPKAYGVWYGQQFQPKAKSKVILVEGEMDAISMSKIIKRHVVWASMGSSISREQIKTIQALKNPVVLFMDNDEAGHTAKSKLIKKLEGVLPAKLYHVRQYAGCKDPSEMVERGVLAAALKSTAVVA